MQTIWANKKAQEFGRFYRIWAEMGSRCNNPKRNNYQHYGARGIKRTWDKFEDFKEDMYTSYLEHVAKFGEGNTSIDRIDGTKDYTKENCRWATQKQQMRNVKNNVLWTYEGMTKTIAEWAELKGMKYITLYSRVKDYGFTIEDALSLPVKKRGFWEP